MAVFAGSHQRVGTGLTLAQLHGVPLFISSYRVMESLEALCTPEEIGLIRASAAITLDERALTTRDNALHVREWLAENDLRRPALVTDGFHMPRALLEFRRVNKGIEPQPVRTANIPTGEITPKIILLEPVKYMISRFAPRRVSAIRLPEAF